MIDFKSQQFMPNEGAVVYLLPGGNATRNWSGSPIKATITSVKRKYFYVKETDYSYPLKFDKEANRFVDDSDTNNDYAVFETLESAEDAMRCVDEFYKIKSFLGKIRPWELTEAIESKKVHEIYQTLFKGE